MATFYADGWTGDNDETGFISSAWQPQNYSYGGRIQSVTAGTCTSIAVKLERGSGSANVKAALYDGSGNLIVETTAQLFSAGVATWVSWTISETVSAGTYHVLYSSADDQSFIEYNTDATGKYVEHAYAAAFPDPGTIGDEASLAYGAKMEVVAGGASFTVDPAGATSSLTSDAGAVAQVTFSVAPAGAAASITSDAGSVAQVTFQVSPAKATATLRADAGAVSQGFVTVYPVGALAAMTSDTGSVSQVTFQVDPAGSVAALTSDAGAVVQVTFQVAPVGAAATPTSNAGSVVQVTFTVVPAGAAAAMTSDAGSVNMSVPGDTLEVGPGKTYTTIQAAVNAAQAGDLVLVDPGTYNEKIDTVRNGTAGNPIIIRANGTVIIQTFTNVDHNYITIDGFDMTGANEGHMIRWVGNNGRAVNNTIYETGATWSIFLVDGSDFYASGNRYYSTTGPGDDLIIFSSSGNNCLIENNEIGPAVDVDGFRLWGHDNVVRRNYLHTFSRSGGSVSHIDVMQVHAVGGGESYNIVFEDNLVDDSAGSGELSIMMSEMNGYPDVRDWDIRNNIYIGVGEQANIGIQNVRFQNNTLYDCGRVNNLVIYAYDDSPRSNYSGLRVKNNVFITDTTTTSYNGVMSIGTTGTNIEVSNNYCAVVGTWAALTDFTDTNGINGGDPGMVDPSNSDFHLLLGSILRNAGTVLAEVTDDYDGVTRPQGATHDMGAFEYDEGVINMQPAGAISSPTTDQGVVTQVTFSISPAAAISQITADFGVVSITGAGAGDVYAWLNTVTDIRVGSVLVTKVYNGPSLIWERPSSGVLEFDGETVTLDGEEINL